MAVVGVVGRIGVPLAVLCVATSACGLLDESAALSGTVPRPTGPPEAAAAEFLAAWSAGDDARAAQLTTDATTAATTIADVRRRLGVTAVQAVPEATPGATKVPFAATVALGEAGTWIYRSTVQVVASRGRWAVRWSPAVIHPKLRNGSHLTIGPVPAAPVPPTVVDRNGQVLTTQAHPSLATILPQIIAVAPAGPPKPATAVKVVDDATGAETPLEVVAKESGNTVASTFDARIQSAAQQAISGAPGPAALVVVQPGTGHILALANNPPGQKVATHSGAAPGSAFKAVVASALVSAGDTPTTPVPCPETYTIPNGRSFKNDHPGDTNLEATLEQDFAVSCNTAFVQRGIDKLPPSALIQHAGGAFGLAGPWDIGLGDPRTYWSVPDPGANRDLYGEDLIGQGKITMEPLALASVAATARTGTFRQPILIPGARQVPAGRPANADALRRMMRRTVTNGTASSLARLAGDVGAKTGTADITGGNANWMIAYRGSDLAVACLVITTDDHRGNDTAGPLVTTLFQSI